MDDASLARLSDDPNVHQATGMLSVQLDSSVADAEAWLREYAVHAGKPVVEVAREVVARRLHFQP